MIARVAIRSTVNRLQAMFRRVDHVSGMPPPSITPTDTKREPSPPGAVPTPGEDADERERRNRVSAGQGAAGRRASGWSTTDP